MTRKLLGDYGMVLVLIVLCLLFSVLTLKEQTSQGSNATTDIVEQINARFGKSDLILVVGAARTDSAALAEKVVERSDLHRRPDRRIRQDQVQPMKCQLGQKLLRRVFHALEQHAFRKPQGRLQNPVCDELGHHVGNACGQSQRAAPGPALGSVHEIATEAEDLVGIAVDDPSEVGENETATRASEQLPPQ